MNIALLNTRITIQKNEVNVDAIGNHKSTWNDWYHCYATVSNESPDEASQAGMTVDNTKVDFTIRWCRNAAAITPENYRVIFFDEVYNHMNFKKKAVKLKCQKVRRS